MIFLQSCVCVHTTIWIYHTDTNETQKEKARWEQYKNATCCFKQILETIPHKIAVVQLSITHLINHPSKTNMTCKALQEI